MKRTVRKGVFETNSSSVHTITVAKRKMTYSTLPTLEFTLDDFGWDVDELATPFEKARYLYTAMVCYDCVDAYKQYITDTLAEIGCKAEFQPVDDDYYIDHASGVRELIDLVTNSKDCLLAYLFDPKSVVYTYNDNMDYEDLPFFSKIMRAVDRGGYTRYERVTSPDCYTIVKGN